MKNEPIGPDPRHLDSQARGKAAERLLDSASEMFSDERKRIEKAVSKLIDENLLTPEQAISFCAQLQAVYRLERHLETMIRAGQVASKRLIPSMEQNKSRS